jgi:Notch-like protein
LSKLIIFLRILKGTCEEIAGKTQCTCDRGFTGKFCDIIIDQCKPNPCENNGICHNLIDDYYCACLPEYGNSRNCSDRLIDPCLSSPCYNDATCNAVTVSSGSDKKKVIYKNFTCRCKSGFKGEFCEITTDPCSSSPCSNRGNCVVSKGTEDYVCRCYPSFTGKNCETYYDPCSDPSNSCKNGGSCLATPEGYKCMCPSIFGGEK